MRSIRPEERDFALCFARTLSIAEACAAAGFDRRTSFARARNLLERPDVREFVRAAILDRAVPAPDGSAADGADLASSDDPLAGLMLSEGRIMREYEKIAFAESSKDGEVKIADKLRALEAYRTILERRAARAAGGADGAESLPPLTVNYDYGGGDE